MDLSENSILKINYKKNSLILFWFSLQETFPLISSEALRVLLPFSASYHYEVGFSAMAAIKDKYRNKLQVENSLRLKLTKTKIDLNSVINENAKQIHSSHIPHY